ncbi:MAG: hypothetical protein NT001_03700 [Candidatus Woesearchaeota archaeon]|nr:hypothetical protein [Candidatus Woesearchaeota archaeon]
MGDNYGYKTTLLKGLKIILYTGIPAAISFITDIWKPSWAAITIGGILVMLENYLKNKNK